MAAMDFPAAPTVGQLYPATPIAGIPQYKWDGTAWVAVLATEMQNYVQRTGDTMTGALTLSGDPTAILHAATKQYVDGGVGGVGGGLTAKVDKAGGVGGIMTGLLTLSADPTAVLHAATKQYVDVGDMAGLAASGMQINGGMEVSQELAASNVAIPVNGVKYIVDGWFGTLNGTHTISAGQSAAGPPQGFSNFLNAVVTTANSSPAATAYCSLVQRIEGYRISRIAWGTANAKPITISFWVFAVRTGNYSGSVFNSANNRSYPFLLTVNVASTWEFKTFTVPGDATGVWEAGSGVGLNIYISMMVGTTYQAPAGAWAAGLFLGATGSINGVAATSDNFRITGFTVLPGTQTITAAQSPLLMRSYGQELAICQRYYQKSWNQNTRVGTADGAGGCAVSAAGAGSGGISVASSLLVTMRATPTITIYDGAGTPGVFSYFNGSTWLNGGTAIANLYSADSFMYFQENVASVYNVNFNYVVDARL